jgi:hypothetical protein
MATAYSVTLVNETKSPGSVCVFIATPQLQAAGFTPLAWLTRFVYPRTRVAFGWLLDYAFVCGTVERLENAVFRASQTVTADLISSNAVTLTYAGGALALSAPRAGTHGSLVIRADATIPPDCGMAGVAIGGTAALVTPAVANRTVVLTPPAPEYRIAFGAFVQGQLMEAGSIARSAVIRYPAGVYGATVVLDGRGFSVEC